METCMMKPEVKKKPKSIKRNEPDPPPPAVPQRPTDAELSHTQYRLNKMTATNHEELKSPIRYSQHSPSAQTEDAESNYSVLTGIFQRSQKERTPTFTGAEMLHGNLSASTDSLSETEEKGGLFSGLPRKTPKTPGEGIEAQKELLTSNDDLSDHYITEWLEVNTEDQLSVGCENMNDSTVTKETNADEEQKLSASDANLSEANAAKGKTGGLAGLFKRSPKPSPRSIATQDPLSSQLSDSWDSLTDAGKEDDLPKSRLSAGIDNLSETSSTPREGEDMEGPEGGGLRCKTTIKKKRRVVSFRVKKTLPKIPQIGLASQSSEKMPVTEQTFEMQDISQAQDPLSSQLSDSWDSLTDAGKVSTVVVQPVEMAAYPAEENPAETEPEEDELMEWWNTVKGWKEWNETSDFQEEDEEMAMEQAADRVYMAARLFVRLFNQRGGSLQQRILELLAMADAADNFHKKTVSAAVGGGVASVAGSITTITGLILAPFTFGASIIVTAVGISVATAGSITSATANITDTVHSNMDSKKVEKIIQGYQEEIKGIRECLEFVQEGIDALQEWDFEKYTQSAAKKALNHNIKHVMKEGGRAGKALMINADKLISTVQVLGAAGGVAKAAKAISVTTGVISALFLALDVFFLARDSHELRKGAKTKFASKIREVCKDLQNGLLELNKVKTQLQKTMDGIEVEEFEEVEEVEAEVEDDLVSDPKKLAELEQDLDLLEERVDKKVEDVQKKGEEMDKENSEESVKEKDAKEKKKDKEKKEDNSIKDKEKKSKLEKELEKVKSTSEGNKSERVKVEREKNTERRHSEKDKEREHSHQGHRARSNAFLGDGLNI